MPHLLRKQVGHAKLLASRVYWTLQMYMRAKGSHLRLKQYCLYFLIISRYMKLMQLSTCKINVYSIQKNSTALEREQQSKTVNNRLHVIWLRVGCLSRIMTSLLHAAHTCDEHRLKYRAVFADHRLVDGDFDVVAKQNKSRNGKSMLFLFWRL